MKTITALLACSDLNSYARLSARMPPEEVGRILSGYYELVGDIIAPASGHVIKFMGDTALMIFPETQADAAVRALLNLQIEGDHFLAGQQLLCRHRVRLHFGPVCFGPLGTREEKRNDVLGPTVNTLFLIKAGDFAMTPEVFRKLQPETRKLFKKHTPPIVYIPLDQIRPD